MAANKGPEKARSAVNSLVTAIAVIASLIGLNLIASRYFARADLTEDHIYKLSRVSLDTVKNLPDRMNVKAFISGELQAPLNQYGRYVRDILDEYKIGSNGKVDWEAIDPLEGKEEERNKKKEDLSKYKIQKITLERISESKLEIGSDNYLGIAFVYGDQIESIPQVTSTEGLEYQITGIIRKLVSPKKKKIGLANTEGELTQQQGLQILSHQIGLDYDAAPVGLDKPIPDDIDALIIAGAKQPFQDKAKFYLDQFIMKGKPVAMFIDGMRLSTPQGMQMPGMEQPKIGQANDVNLQDQLDKYGIKIRDDLVFDQQNAPGPVPVQGQMFVVNYPTFVVVKDTGFTKGSELTKTIGGLIFPFASSLELTGDVKDGKGSVKATALARTTEQSWRNAGFFVFNPQAKLTPPTTEADKGPFVLAYSLEGKFKTAFPAGMPGTDPGTSAPDNANALKESPDATRLLVIGCSQMVDDDTLRVYRAVPLYAHDVKFVADAVDWLTHDDSLIALRAKGMGQRPFIIGADPHAGFWKWMIQAGVPILLVVFGVVLMFLRGARRDHATLANL